VAYITRTAYKILKNAEKYAKPKRVNKMESNITEYRQCWWRWE